MKNLGVFLIVVALVTGMVGCGDDGGGIETYELTILSTFGGSVTEPGEGVYAYDEGTVVSLVAEAENGYWLVGWTGDTNTVASVYAASTSITMNGDYSITANFREDEIVLFADPNLEAVIREAIGKPTGDIYASECANLMHLSAIDRGIKDLSGIEYCTRLSEVILGPVASASGLSLDSVSLTEQGTGQPNQISDLSPLSYCSNITYLCLWNNNISDIWPLANLINLEHLNLNNNPLSDISPLGNLTKLEILGLFQPEESDASISDISPLANLTNLTELDLWGNQISDISPLGNLTKLTVLGLNYNQISDISPLAHCTNLTRLGLLRNYQISDISPLAHCTNLTALWLGYNQISDISPLANFTNPTRLYLYNNQIMDISPLVQNEGIDAGDIVRLADNPLSDDSINIYIPQLEARGVDVSY